MLILASVLYLGVDMALFVNQNDKRTELQERVAAELRAKAVQRSKMENKDMDGVSDQRYMEDKKVTTSLAWVWVLIFVFIVVAVVYFIVKMNEV